MATDEEYLTLLRRLTPGEKIAVAQQLRETAWRLAAAGLRARHADWSEDAIQDRTRELFLRAAS